MTNPYTYDLGWGRERKKEGRGERGKNSSQDVLKIGTSETTQNRNTRYKGVSKSSENGPTD
jgi:hypothetical protein